MPYDPSRFDPYIKVRCNLCGRERFLRGPLERVQFVLSSMTSCPAGGLHDTLPTAASHLYIMKGDLR
jgi:hypothetical protein